jgi:hypothetical protein
MAKRNPLDRLDDFLDRLCNPFFDLVDQKIAPKVVPEATHKWWVVTNSTMTHMVITDPARCIVIAPTVWNRFIGMNLDLLLEKVHAQATKIPGPYSTAWQPQGLRKVQHPPRRPADRCLNLDVTLGGHAAALEELRRLQRARSMPNPVRLIIGDAVAGLDAPDVSNERARWPRREQSLSPRAPAPAR